MFGSAALPDFAEAVAVSATGLSAPRKNPFGRPAGARFYSRLHWQTVSESRDHAARALQRRIAREETRRGVLGFRRDCPVSGGHDRLDGRDLILGRMHVAVSQRQRSCVRLAWGMRPSSRPPVPTTTDPLLAATTKSFRARPRKQRAASRAALLPGARSGARVAGGIRPGPARRSGACW